MTKTYFITASAYMHENLFQRTETADLVKGGFSHALGAAGHKLKAVWQPSYYEHRVRDAAECARIRNYIHQNPVRRRLVAVATEYPYSSANTSLRLDEVPERLKPTSREPEFTRA